LQFQNIGLNGKLGLSTAVEIAGDDPEKNYIITWIQDALGIPPTYKYDLLTWLVVKESKRQAGLTGKRLKLTGSF